MSSSPTPDDVALARRAAAHPLDAAVTADPDLPARLAAADWAAGVVEEGGQFHRVLVLPGTGAVRITRTTEAAERLPDRMAVIDLLARTPGLPFTVPTPLTEVVTVDSPGPPVPPDSPTVPDHREAGRQRQVTAAVVQRFLPGGPHPPHEADEAALRSLRGLCKALAAVDTAPLQAHLGPPFAFRGPWSPQKVAAVQAVPELLSRTTGTDAWPGRGAASTEHWAGTVATLTDLATRWTLDPVVPPSLVHGDLAGHNMRWRQNPDPVSETTASGDRAAWTLTGILDWDLAAVWDPALNPAYLALWHGEDTLDAITRDPDEALRARVWLGCMALESVYDASLREGPGSPAGRPDWARLLRKVLPRIERAVAAAQQWRVAGSLGPR